MYYTTRTVSVSCGCVRMKFVPLIKALPDHEKPGLFGLTIRVSKSTDIVLLLLTIFTIEMHVSVAYILIIDGFFLFYPL